MNAFKVPVIESEKGWGQKIDDFVIFLTEEKANEFILEFNSKNDVIVVPDWYMQCEEASPVLISEKQLEFIKNSEEQYSWWDNLKNVK